MPIRTENYLLEAFIDGDAYISVSDYRRFSTIDNQFNRMAEIIGNGRIDGWIITPGTFPDVTVTAGSGLVDKYYVNTFGDLEFELSSNGIFFFYAQRKSGIIGSSGPKSNVTSVVYVDAGAPAVPANLTGSIDVSAIPLKYDVTLNWDTATEIDFRHYLLQRDGTTIATITDIADSFYIDEVDEDDTYAYSLATVDLSDNSSAELIFNVSVPISSITPPNPILYTQPHLQWPESEAGLNVLWRRPTSIEFSKIKKWLITYVELNTDNTENLSTLASIDVSKNLYEERIDNLKIGQRYRVTLHTVDTHDRLSTGVVKTLTPQPTPAPRDPTGIGVSFSEGEFGVTLNFSWTSGDTPYDPAISYRYRIYPTIGLLDEALPIDVQPIGVTEEQISLYTFGEANFNPIPENTLMSFRLTSLDVDGFESFGSFISFVTPTFTLPIRLGNVQSNFDFNTRDLTITWENQVDTKDIVIIISDDDLDGTVTEVVNTILDKVEFYILTSASLNHKYTISLTPLNEDGVSGPTSTTVELTASPNLTQPALPTQVNTKNSDRQILLRWQAGNSIFVNGYKVYRKAGRATFVAEDWTLLDILPSSITSFTDYGLTNSQLYTYYITSTDIYNRESPHIPDGEVNMNFVSGTPRVEGILTEPTGVSAVLNGTNVNLSWNALLEEFDGFTILRSIGNLHSWEQVTTVDRNTFAYTDFGMPLVDGTTFYYVIDKILNDADIVVQTTDDAPDNSILLGELTLTASAFLAVDVSNRRDIQDLVDPLAEYTNTYILPHRHREIEANDPTRIDLNPELIITEWATVDNRIWTTTEDIQGGTSYLVKVDGRFPKTFFTVNETLGQIIFSEPIFPTGGIRIIDETTHAIELKIIGIEETQGILEESRFDNIHARQVQFGRINEEQLPDINHEGRIREIMFPDRYFMERYNNHSFIIPQNNIDETKTLGNGTTFFSVIESDGLIEEVIDFDLEDDGDLVGFRRPSFSIDTISNLQQTIQQSLLEDGNDNAHTNDGGSGEWETNPDTLIFGTLSTSAGGDSFDSYMRFPIDVPRGSNISSTKLFLSADNVDPGIGDNARLQISILDPSEYSDEVNLLTSAITTITDLGTLGWAPAVWSTRETVSVDITNLMKLFVNSSSYSEGRHAIIKIVTLNTTTTGHYRISESFTTADQRPFLETQYVLDMAEVDSETGGFQSTKSYHFQFQFADNIKTRWVRIVTTDTPIKPNPIIDLRKRLRFRVLLKSGSIYVNFGIREITSTGIVGENGGTTGPIEWVAATETVELDGVIAPKGILIQPSELWQEIDVDLQGANIINFQNGDGLLSRGLGVLEHLAFTINPDDANPTGPFDIYIDKLEQVDDILVSGTSQGILLSRDFGVSWALSRLTDTSVHKFYRGENNGLLWALTASEVLIATDPAFWYVISGTTGVQYIKDITEDNAGNVYISTDIGVFFFEIALLTNFTTFLQTQPITAFTTDCYGMYHNPVSSGIDEIWVSTEIGIYKTLDQGASWEDSGMTTGGLSAFNFMNISEDVLVPNVIAITRKHVLRRLGDDLDFSTIANFEAQHGIFDIWKMEYFNGQLYISTGSGVYTNRTSLSTTGDIDVEFYPVFPDLNINDNIGVAFSLDNVVADNTRQLFIGQENRLMVANTDGSLNIKSAFGNKELPSFFVDNNETTIGYVYSVFNGVVNFREPVDVNKVVTSAFIPRKKYIAQNAGWALTNPGTEVFIYKNGFPKWIYFTLDESAILAEVQLIEGGINGLPALTSFNSLLPSSEEHKTATLDSIIAIKSGGEDGVPLINNKTLINFLDNYTRFLSLITADLQDDNLFIFPEISLNGIDRDNRSTGTRAEELEIIDDFEADDAVGIDIATFSGIVDFTNAFAAATTAEARDLVTFDKYDHLNITVFESNVSNIGEFTHKELEDQLESFNTGMTSHMGRIFNTNLIKLGITLESTNNFMFSRYNVSNIQSQFYAAHNNDWYDILNSTIDYRLLEKIDNHPEPRFTNATQLFTDDPYLANKFWVGTDNDILQYGFDSNGEVEIESIIRPGGGFNAMFIYDIFYDGTNVYVVAMDQITILTKIFFTFNFGQTWEEIDSINLPNEIYTFNIINNNKVVGTEEGMFYSDNDFGNWFPCDVVPSAHMGSNTAAIDAFRKRIRRVDQSSTFLIAESDRWFYTSSSGIEFFAVGRVTENSSTVVNDVMRYKNLTWVSTDHGIYNDGNSILSDNVSFGLETSLENSITASAALKINDIVHGTDAIYCCGSNGKIYRFWDADTSDAVGNIWESYTVPDMNTIHKMLLSEEAATDYLVVFSYNRVKSIDVTPGTGVFG